MQKFLNGQTEGVNLENEILSLVTFAKHGRYDETVSERVRFTDYMNVDRLIKEVTPLYALFGPGEAHQLDSFGVVMGEVKDVLSSIPGLAPIEQEDLVHGFEYIVKRFVMNSMHSGDRVLQRIFKSKDPLAEVEQGKFLQFNAVAVKETLKELREGVKDRQKEQRKFKSSYDRRTGDAVCGVEHIQCILCSLTLASL